MPVKIRLQRHGKKGKPFYWIVAADARSKRDGKFLEKLGIYNPNTNPATIDLNVDGAVKWLTNGAQPSDTAKRLLSYKGALLKHHLLGGLRKGALTEEQVAEKFNAWVAEKDAAVAAKISGLTQEQEVEKAKALAAEKAVNEKRVSDAQALEAEAAAEVAAAEAAEIAATEAAAAEVAATEEVVAEEAPATEEAVAEEAPATEEAVAEEAPATEEAVAEEAPATEAADEETKEA
ncbi:30S ribosomal protein S16 [Flavobacteriaceae bacterium]|nr:30S ribosomal protein S16 [Flavobacteriaceae bacterium]MDB4495474.1 30S ribosomal protein S16 [Flavobacteriaceae bacterium]MDC1448812.1 30S ribosomal protein S16 [Flavobacteriaceae bacterium]